MAREIQQSIVCLFSVVAVTKSHKWEGLKQRNLFCRSSGGQRSELKMLAGSCSLKALGEDASLPPPAVGGCSNISCVSAAGQLHFPLVTECCFLCIRLDVALLLPIGTQV